MKKRTARVGVWDEASAVSYGNSKTPAVISVEWQFYIFSNTARLFYTFSLLNMATVNSTGSQLIQKVARGLGRRLI